MKEGEKEGVKERPGSNLKVKDRLRDESRKEERRKEGGKERGARQGWGKGEKTRKMEEGRGGKKDGGREECTKNLPSYCKAEMFWCYCEEEKPSDGRLTGRQKNEQTGCSCANYFQAIVTSPVRQTNQTNMSHFTI